MSSIYQHDLENRFSNYTFTQSTDGDMCIWTVTDDDNDDAVVCRSRGMTDGVALKKLRVNMVGDDTVLPCVTAAQHASVTAAVGQMAIDMNGKVSFWDGSLWAAVSST